MKAQSFRAALQIVRCVGLASLLLVVFVAMNHGVIAVGGGSIPAKAAAHDASRGGVPPIAHEHHQVTPSSVAMLAFEQAADEQPDADPVRDFVLDVSGLPGADSRTYECVRSAAARGMATQVVRARLARGPPV